MNECMENRFPIRFPVSGNEAQRAERARMHFIYFSYFCPLCIPHLLVINRFRPQVATNQSVIGTRVISFVSQLERKKKCLLYWHKSDTAGI